MLKTNKKKWLYINNLSHLASLSEYYLRLVKKLFRKVKLLKNQKNQKWLQFQKRGKVVVRGKIEKKLSIWRFFQRMIRNQYKSHYFTRFKYFYNNSLKWKKKFSQVYGLKTIKKFKQQYQQFLKSSSHKIYYFLHCLNFRLDLLLVRTYFSSNIKNAKAIINYKQVYINNIVCTRFTYIFKPMDILSIQVSKIQDVNWLLFRKKVFYRRRRFYRKFINKELKYNFLSKNKFKNFLEINYCTGMIIYLRLLLNNESVSKKIQFISKNSLKKKRKKFRNNTLRTRKKKKKFKKFMFNKISEFRLNYIKGFWNMI